MSPSHDDGRKDFDFLFGSWQVQNRKLTRPLSHSDDWEEFETTARAAPILDGLGNMDSFRRTASARGGEWEGMSLRLFDPERRNWSIWWMSTARPGHLEPPVVGGFVDGRGEFFGDDEYAGRPIRVRYLWRTADPRWEQAFSVDGGATWETNWVMSFARAS